MATFGEPEFSFPQVGDVPSESGEKTSFRSPRLWGYLKKLRVNPEKKILKGH
jgi:hypothetical protein